MRPVGPCYHRRVADRSSADVGVVEDGAPYVGPVGDACPVETAIELIGGKWRLLIVRALIVDGPRRFNELSRTIVGISHKVLTQNLRDLEAAGLVERVEANGHARYGVTEIAAELTPILHALGEWRRRYDGR